MTTFEVAEQQGPRSCVVQLSGDIDTAVVPELRERLGSALEGGCANVVLDLSDVVYADSSALGLLVWLDHQLVPLSGRLVLAGANPDVRRILELSGLINVASSITTSDDVTGALEGLELAETPSEFLWSERFDMAAGVDNLASARERACSLIAPLGFGESALFDIKVALGEALANAVRHGSIGSKDATVGVGIDAYEDRVVVEVSDQGCGFNGISTKSDDLYAPGGRGIMFMRALMDRVEFETPQSGGTLVRLVKHRTGEMN
jgi:stage II sporulation protein AA (anti-sigma F factor antagonist)